MWREILLERALGHLTDEKGKYLWERSSTKSKFNAFNPNISIFRGDCERFNDIPPRRMDKIKSQKLRSLPLWMKAQGIDVCNGGSNLTTLWRFGQRHACELHNILIKAVASIQQLQLQGSQLSCTFPPSQLLFLMHYYHLSQYTTALSAEKDGKKNWMGLSSWKRRSPVERNSMRYSTNKRDISVRLCKQS